MNILAQTMSDDIFQKVVECNSAKEIWTSLNNMVDGSADERKDKKSHLITQYENFRKGEDESVADMHTRLSSIINELKTLDKVISLTEINDKILMCLPSSWDSRIWPIREIRSLNEISTENLLGKLKSYEQLVKSREADSSTSSPAAKKEKNIAFQAEEERKSTDDLDMMSLLAKRFYKMAKKDFRKKDFRRNEKQRYEKKNTNEIICYNCRKPGHISPECPENQRKEKRKEKEDKAHSRKSSSHKIKKRDKGFVAETWSDTESETSSTSSGSEDSKQEENQCLLAVYDSYTESEDTSSSSSSDDESERAFCMMAINATEVNSEDSEPEEDCDQAGTGIAELIALEVSKQTKAPVEETRKKIWLVDSKGLIVSSRKESLQHFKKPWAHEHEPVGNLLDAVKAIKPTILIGSSGVGKTFTKEVVEAVASFNEKPVILALSNPTSQSECTAEEAYTWSNGRAIFASGSPFDSVEYNGKVYVPGQANNAYIFPGFGLGVVMSGAIRVHDDMLLAASEALAQQVTQENFDKGLIYPPFKTIRKISAQIAANVAAKAYELGLASNLPRPANLVKYAESCMYSPVYRTYR